MNPQEMQDRTRRFALRMIHLSDALPHKRSTDALAKQIVRCGTSVGANYRSACHARSQADFVAKMGVVEEEIDESIYWMELISDAKMIPTAKLDALLKEAHELLAITIASIKTARGKKRN